MAVDELVSLLRRLKDSGYISHVRGYIPDAPIFHLAEISAEDFEAFDSWVIHFPGNRAADGSDTFEVRFESGALREVRNGSWE